MYEANSYAGGHSNTIRVDTEHETHHVDTGFIVMNDRNYPNFTRLLDRLGVATQPTHMSFSVKGEEEDFEYSGTPRGLFCQPRNLLSPRFQRMIAGPAALQPGAAAAAEGHEDDGRVARGASSAATASRAPFVERLIVPQVSAVWSADPRQMHSFPARFMAEFFANHGMLGFRDRPRWSTIAGGSARYVEALTAPFARAHPAERSRALDRAPPRARGDRRGRAGARDAERFDQVIIADPLRSGAARC